jgi:hypothetical protein
MIIFEAIIRDMFHQLKNINNINNIKGWFFNYISKVILGVCFTNLGMFKTISKVVFYEHLWGHHSKTILGANFFMYIFEATILGVYVH